MERGSSGVRLPFASPIWHSIHILLRRDATSKVKACRIPTFTNPLTRGTPALRLLPEYAFSKTVRTPVDAHSVDDLPLTLPPTHTPQHTRASRVWVAGSSSFQTVTTVCECGRGCGMWAEAFWERNAPPAGCSCGLCVQP